MVDARNPSGGMKTDAELIVQVRSGNEEALAQLCARYIPLCRRVAGQYAGAPVDVDDLAQEGTLGLLEAVRRYDEKRGVPFEHYARRCITSKILSAIEAMTALKRRANVGSVPLDVHAGLSVPPPEDRFIEEEELRQHSRALLELLSPSEHEVLRLYLRGVSYVQIARQLGIKPKSVDNALQRVRHKVKRSVKGGA